MNSPNELSFLPDDYLERKAQRRTNVICAALFFVVMVTICTAFTYSDKSIRAMEAEHARVNASYAEAARRIEQMQKMLENQRRMAQQAELTASLLEKVPRSNLLAELTNALPGGVSLLDFTLDSKKQVTAAPSPKSAFEKRKAEMNSKKSADDAPPPPQPQSYEVTLKLTGVAGTDIQVAQFMSKLGTSRLLREVNLLITEACEVDGDKMRKFQIEAKLARDAQVTPESSATAAMGLNAR